MNKSDVIKILKEKFPHIPPRDVELMVDMIIDAIADALKKNNRIEIRGFGHFTTRRRKSRDAKNPKTNETIHLPERFAIHFKEGKEIKEVLEESCDQGRSDIGHSPEKA